jgi:hypothetical protein
MTNDIYTRVVLSIIALCLIWIGFGRATPVVSAQAEPQKVVVAGWDRPLPVMLVDEKGQPLATADGLRVSSTGQPLVVRLEKVNVPVTIASIERSGTWQPIPVDVMRSPLTDRPAF